MAPKSGLSVRQHAREDISLPIEFIVSKEHQEQVRFSASSTAARYHLIRGTAIDISRGGLGMASNQYLPRMCEGRIRIFDSSVTTLDDEQASEVKPIFETKVKVRRVLLEGHTPSYFIGMAFINPPTDLLAKMLELFYAQEKGDSDA